jgi:hypothetical protein
MVCTLPAMRSYKMARGTVNPTRIAPEASSVKGVAAIQALCERPVPRATSSARRVR